MRSLFFEFRIYLAEMLLHRALDVMPSAAPEAVPLARAARSYCDEARKMSRWEKFPA